MKTLQDELERVIGEVLADPAYQKASTETQKLMLANRIHALMEES